jgi:protein-tyrosine phosphatase
MSTQRWLPLEGGRNFRDLGGYETADGRAVRWGRVFRSGSLADLTEVGVERLSRLELGLICDFRSDEERMKWPSRLPVGDEPQVAHLAVRPVAESPLEELLTTGRIWETMEARNISPEDTRRAMANIYRSYARDHTAQYSVLMHKLSDAGDQPVLFHCAAGKDRTGFAAAVILRALGVSMELILEDYLLTNRVIDAWLEQREGDAYPTHIRAVLGAHEDFLGAAFEAVDQEFGSFEAYLRDALAITEERHEGLRNALLE